jgi:outer membrane protein W
MYKFIFFFFIIMLYANVVLLAKIPPLREPTPPLSYEKDETIDVRDLDLRGSDNIYRVDPLNLEEKKADVNLRSGWFVSLGVQSNIYSSLKILSNKTIMLGTTSATLDFLKPENPEDGGSCIYNGQEMTCYYDNNLNKAEYATKVFSNISPNFNIGYEWNSFGVDLGLTYNNMQYNTFIDGIKHSYEEIKLNSNDIFIKTYYKLNLHYPVIPYVGLGVGYSLINLGITNTRGENEVETYNFTDKLFAPIYMLNVGLQYNISKHFALNMEVEARGLMGGAEKDLKINGGHYYETQHDRADIITTNKEGTLVIDSRMLVNLLFKLKYYF